VSYTVGIKRPRDEYNNRNNSGVDMTMITTKRLASQNIFMQSIKPMSKSIAKTKYVENTCIGMRDSLLESFCLDED